MINEEFIVRDPMNPGPWAQHAVALYWQNEFNYALETIEQALIRAPHSIDYLYFKSMI